VKTMIARYVADRIAHTMRKILLDVQKNPRANNNDSTLSTAFK
jgi:hypothetical protein